MFGHVLLAWFRLFVFFLDEKRERKRPSSYFWHDAVPLAFRVRRRRFAVFFHAKILFLVHTAKAVKTKSGIFAQKYMYAGK